MISFFKNNSPTSIVILPVMALLLWLSGFFNFSVLSVKHEMPLFETVAFSYNTIPWVMEALTFITVVLTAFLINYISNENELLGRPNYVVGLVYLLLMSSLPSLLMPTAFLFGNVFVLFAIQKIISSYKQSYAGGYLFDASLLLGVASLFDFSYILLLPFLWISVAIIRPFNWKEWIIPAIGYLVPYLFVGVYFFWIGRLDYLLYDKMFYNIIYEPFVFRFTGKEKPVAITLGILLALALFNYFAGNSRSQKLKSQKALQIMGVLLLFLALSVLISREFTYELLAQCAVPASLFIGRYLYVIKRPLVAEVFFFFLLALIVMGRF